eukprot:3283777-Rhodomonas_salina.1
MRERQHQAASVVGGRAFGADEDVPGRTIRDSPALGGLNPCSDRGRCHARPSRARGPTRARETLRFDLLLGLDHHPRAPAQEIGIVLSREQRVCALCSDRCQQHAPSCVATRSALESVRQW